MSSRVAKMTLYRHFSSKDDLAIAVLGRRVELWTLGWLVPEIERRASTPAGRALAIFDAFDEWFHGRALEDFQGCLFINVLLETHDWAHPVGAASRAGMLDIRAFLRRLMTDAGAGDPDALARRCHLLMKGAIVAATMGDLDAARDAREVAAIMLESEGLLANEVR